MKKNDKKMEKNMQNGAIKFKCYSCGKHFLDVTHLTRHKDRKTPCLIQDIKLEDVHNPNKCHYCNKIFKCKQNLLRHFETCKIKNGGTEILYEKVVHERKMEEELKKLKEKLEEQKAKLKESKRREERSKEKEKESKKQLEEQSRKQTEMMEKVLERVNSLEKELRKANPVAIPQNNTQNNTQINVKVELGGKFVLRSYMDPYIAGPITREEFRPVNCDYKPVCIFLCNETWFNPKTPENHSLVILSRKKRGRKGKEPSMAKGELRLLGFDGERWIEKQGMIAELTETLSKIFMERMYGAGCEWDDKKLEKDLKISPGSRRRMEEMRDGIRRLELEDLEEYANKEKIIGEAIRNGLAKVEVRQIMQGPMGLVK
jgi:flagellar biosynthesis GTPase FlhF